MRAGRPRSRGGPSRHTWARLDSFGTPALPGGALGRPVQIRILQKAHSMILNMDRQDAQDKQEEMLLQAELTGSMNGCVLKVINRLGSGHLESLFKRG